MQPNDDTPAQPEKRNTVDNTVDNRLKNLEGRKPFTKGDKRINRKGRPKSFKQLRKLFVDVGLETVDKTEMTRIYAMVRKMYASDNPKHNELALTYGWGKVPDELKATVKTDKVEAYDYNSAIAALAPRPDEDSDTPGEDQGSGDGAQVGQNTNGG